MVCRFFSRSGISIAAIVYEWHEVRLAQFYGITIRNPSDFFLEKLISLVYNICRFGIHDIDIIFCFVDRNTMDCKRRLLILSCSQRKNTSQGQLPAIDRYNGPLFFVLRRFLRECPHEAKQLDVYILSAAYGLIAEDFPTPLYDQKMNMARALELQPQVKTTFSGVLQNNYASICFVLGKTYLKAFKDLKQLIPVHTKPVIAYGPIGKKQTQLKEWLWEKLR